MRSLVGRPSEPTLPDAILLLLRLLPPLLIPLPVAGPPFHFPLAPPRAACYSLDIESTFSLMTRRRTIHSRSRFSRVPSGHWARGVVTLWTALLLGLGLVSQGLPLLTHLMSEDSQGRRHQAELSSDRVFGQANHECSSDRKIGEDSGLGRLALDWSDQHRHHDPQDCETCRSLLIASTWAVPHVPSLGFFGWAPVRAGQVAATERAASFEFRAITAPRGPPARVA